MNKPEHKKIQNTKASLLTAIIHLAKTTDVRDISVSALCKEAGVNRTTFYKYYDIPMDVLEEKMTDIFEGIRESLVFSPDCSDEENLYPILLNASNMCYEERVFLGLCYKCGVQTDRIMARTFMLGENLTWDELYNRVYISGGIGAIFALWGKTGFKESPESIAGKLTELTLKHF